MDWIRREPNQSGELDVGAVRASRLADPPIEEEEMTPATQAIWSAVNNFCLRPKYKPTPNEIDLLENGELFRVGGGVICEHCGKEYNDHPNVEHYEWMTRLCNGQFVKL
jgi:hypothetical protein